MQDALGRESVLRKGFLHRSNDYSAKLFSYICF